MNLALAQTTTVYEEYELEEDAPPEKLEVTFTAEDLPCLLLMAALFLAFVGTIVYLMYRRSSDHLAELQAADELFARSLLREAQTASAPKPDDDTRPLDAVPPDDDTRPLLADPATGGVFASAEISPPPITLPEGDSLAMAIDKLRRLGVIGDREGMLPLAIPPAAPIYRLRRMTGVAVVLPRYESEALVEHCLRRFDLVLIVLQDGNIVALSHVEDRLAELGNLPGNIG